MESHNAEKSSWSRRTETADEVRKRLRSGWKYDAEILEQYFQSCFINWQVYKGERTPKQVVKLQAIYKQALYGDNEEPPPEDLESAEGKKWMEWYKLRGTPKEMAKRRFITFLAEINPSLIDVMPDEKPPMGFPMDRKGNPICAKCNTVVGCSRQLLDQYKMNLKQQLFDNEEFHEPDKLILWVRNAIENQRCVWGMHKAISRAEARPFLDWFNRLENRGFFAYDSISLMKIVRELVFHYFQMTYEMMQNKEDMDPLAYNALATKTLKLKEIFQQFTGEEFKFELDCTRDNDICNSRRLADGGMNHKHELEISPPTFQDTDSMAEAIALRAQCQKLGINPCTGVVKNIGERCNIYRKRIADHFEALKKSQLAKARNDKRNDIHKEDKLKITQYSKSMIDQQGQDACNANQIEQILLLVKQQNCNPNVESNRGLTPMLCLMLNEVPVETIDQLLKCKVDLNFASRYGLTPLMLACRLKDTKMIHYLIKNNASSVAKGGNGRTALHVCVVHGCEDIIRIFVDYLKDGIGDSMRIVRFLDANDDNGESALMLAARLRNGLLCYLLLSLGANPNNRNALGQTAAYIARHSGWNELANYLDKKVSAGVSKIETYSDLQFEKQNRFNFVKIKDLLEKFGKLFLQLIQMQKNTNTIALLMNKSIGNPLGCPFKAQLSRQERGDAAIYEQQTFIDNHCKFMMNLIPSSHMIQALQSNSKSAITSIHHLTYHFDTFTEEEIQEMKKKMQSYVTEMTNLIKQGNANPNTEILAKPLPWTPLMCAIAMNDLKSCRILVRNGANVNHPNMDGTTPVMIAAQLQNSQLLVELLLLRGDIDSVDNQGFNSLGYASSLPLPTVMSKAWCDIVTDGDLYGEKLMNTVQVIKIAKSGGLAQLRDILAENAVQVSSEKIAQDLKIQKLLQRYGLTDLSHEYNMTYQIKSSLWRVDKKHLEEVGNKWENEFEDEEQDSLFAEYEAKAKQLYSDEQEEIKKQQGEDPEGTRGNTPGSAGQLRCPICTLPIPCSHFLKIKSLMKFMTKSKEEQEEERNKMAHSGQRVTKKIKLKDQHQQILEEAEIADRHTDRSATFARKFQAHERSLELSWSDRFPALLAAAEDDEEEHETASALTSETAVPRINNSPASSPNQKKLKIVSVEPTSSSVPGEEITGNLSSSQQIVSILKRPVQGEESSLALITVSNKQKNRRVKFLLPGEEPEFEPNENENAGDSPLIPMSQELIVSAQDENEEQNPNAPHAKSADLVLAMKTLQQGQLVTAATPATDTGPQFVVKKDPLLQYPRRVVMFTRDKFNATSDGITVITKSKKNSSNGGASSKDSTPKLKIHVSGWLFVHLATIQEDILPLENISITQEAWVYILQHLQTKYFDEWAHSHKLHLLVDMKTWKLHAPRCSLCKIGYVRNKESLSLYHKTPQIYYQKANQMMKLLYEQSLNSNQSKTQNNNSQDNLGPVQFDPLADSEEDIQKKKEEVNKLDLLPFLCLQCLIRKQIYEKVVQSLPRTIRKTMQLTWPIIHMHHNLSSTLNNTMQSASLSSMPSTGSFTMSFSNSPSGTEKMTPLLPDIYTGSFSSPNGKINKTSASSSMFDPGNKSQLNRSASFSSTSNPGLSINCNPGTRTGMTLMEELSPMYSPIHRSFSQSFHTHQDFPSTFHSVTNGTPLASQKLLQIDDIVRTHSGGTFRSELDLYHALEADEDDEKDPSLASMSQMSIGENSSQTYSTASTISQVDPIKRPREMTLIPFLISKGHLDEAERIIRITISKQAVDEGEGILYLYKILSWQADMYKNMGLFTLALSIYLDLVDTAASLLGINDYLTKKAISSLLMCYYQMQAGEHAKDYIENILRECSQVVRSHGNQDEIIRNMKSLIKLQRQKFIQSHSVWKIFNESESNLNNLSFMKGMNSPDSSIKFSSSSKGENASSKFNINGKNDFPLLFKNASETSMLPNDTKNELRKEYEEYFGVATFYQFLISANGQEAIARKGFYVYIQTMTKPYVITNATLLGLLTKKMFKDTTITLATTPKAKGSQLPATTNTLTFDLKEIILSTEDHQQGIELLDYLLRLRFYDEEEIINYLLHRIFIKYLPAFTFTKAKKNAMKYTPTSTTNIASMAKTTTNSTNPIVQIFLQSINKDTKQAILLFLQEGILSFGWNIFDTVLAWLLHYYLPFFHRYLVHEPSGEVLRSGNEENVAMMYDIAAKLMQGIIRRNLSSKRVEKIKIANYSTMDNINRKVDSLHIHIDSSPGSASGMNGID